MLHALKAGVKISFSLALSALALPQLTTVAHP
jgi:hypothetical protein